MSRRSLALALVLAPLAGRAGAQGETPPPGEPPPRDEIEELVERASGWDDPGHHEDRSGALRRLSDLGGAAAAVLERILREDPRALDDFGPELVGLVGSFDAPALRAALWNAARDARFPWRIAAANALAASARPEEAEDFAALLDDPLAAVRAAAVRGLAATGDREHLGLVRALLSDPDGRVRRRAADLLAREGESWTLAWLLEELQRDDVFLGARDGFAARAEAHRMLARRLGDDFGYDPEREPLGKGNTAAIAEMVDRFAELTGGASVALPAVARAGRGLEDGVVGLEVRSSSHGDLDLRWDAEGKPWIGRGRAEAVERPGADGAALARAVREALAGLDPEERPAGAAAPDPGCDLERVHVRTDGTILSWSWLRPAREARPRPDELGAALALLMEHLPGEEEAGGGLAERAAAALESVGGPLPD